MKYKTTEGKSVAHLGVAIQPERKDCVLSVIRREKRKMNNHLLKRRFGIVGLSGK